MDKDLAIKKKCPKCGSEHIYKTGKSCFDCGSSWHYCYITNHVTWTHTPDKCLEEGIRIVGEAVDEIERRENMQFDYSSF